MIPANQKFRRLLLLLAITMWVSGCNSSTDVPPVPAEVNELGTTIQTYVDRYNAEFVLRPRPAASAQEAAEAYTARYQPGPTPRIFQSSYLYDREGKFIAELLDEGRRTWVPLDRISPQLRDAVVATEDASFYKNTGVDALRVVGAFVQNAQSGGITSGASTITMQLARNLFFEPERRFDQSMDRKVFEILMAHDLTDLFTKDEILEMYLNIVYFGHRAYGPEAAAWTYFGKTAATLNIAEATLLAGLPQAPGELDLFTNLKGAKDRQRIVLDLMVKRDYLTAKAANAIWAQPIKLGPNPDLNPRLASHFVTYLQEYVHQRLGDRDLQRAGLHITTSLDLSMQLIAQQVVSKTVASLRPTYDLTNGALVALQPGTGQILAMVGSANYNNKAIDGAVNVATSLRQPGSSIKPILYATAFNDNLISPTTVIWDLPVSYPVTSYQVYQPGNYDGKFRGPVTVRAALANSYNVPAVKVLDRVGIDRMRTGAHALGITAFDRNDVNYGLGLTLGSNEVTLLELATAYHTISNAGQYIPAQPIISITDNFGRPLSEFASPLPVQAITPEAAYLVTNILSDNEARTPAFGPNSVLKLTKPAAVKTGTTNSWRDNWTLGFTRYLLAGVWAGNSDGHPMRGISGITGAAPIWHDFMEAVLADPKLLKVLNASANPTDWEFTPPDGVIKIPVSCPKNIGCRTDGEVYSKDWRQKMGEAHLQEDSLVTAKMATVLIGTGRRAGVCTEAGGKQTTVYRLPDGIGQLAPTVAEPKRGAGVGQIPSLPGLLIPPTLSGPTRYFDSPQANFSLLPKRLQDEQNAVLNWSYRSNSPIYLGPCDNLASIAQGLFGKQVKSVTIQTATSSRTVAVVDNPPKVQASKVAANTTASSTAPTVAKIDNSKVVVIVPTPASMVLAPTLQGVVAALPPIPATTPLPPPIASPVATPILAATPLPTLAPSVNNPAQPAAQPSGYAVVAVINDASCSGNYILGEVQNADGTPAAGVRLFFEDQWGNRGESVTKSGTTDYGRYDFPVGQDAPRNISVSIIDGVGNSLSSTVVVQHRQGSDGDAPCHHLIWRAQ